ncbi:MAG: GNAT family N-acetyltransferase [candidate division Zixibacteria bacterium]|nr:GNAT family N-acetyltransferase [candidate division Zixibacteria bacterium]
MEYRAYDAERDREAVHRIWYETGWLEPGKAEHEEAMDIFLGAGRALVADVGGEAECLAHTAPGSLRYLDEDLPFSCVTAVTTSRVARKQGLAKRLTAAAVAADAAEGALVSGLGMFEQGYYDMLGFGTGGYENWFSFDPARLTVKAKCRVPRRLAAADWAAVHRARLSRARGHGGCNLTPPEMTRAEMLAATNGFGLGYADGPGGELSHLMWCSAAKKEEGPYRINWLVYQTGEQFLELMALLRSLGDQVRLVRMREPQGIQLQDLIERPFQIHTLTEKSKFEHKVDAVAYWQMRVLDVPGCLARTRLAGEEIRFNLKLADPIAEHLSEGSAWRGVAGDYVVTLGPTSDAVRGSDKSLSTLAASVGAFTRMWLGARPATGLAVTDDLAGPPGLLEALDATLRLPEPKPDWEF